jgi:SAM-dependent methyltransferase
VLRDNCPICSYESCESFLYRPRVPVHQNQLFPTAAAAQAIKRGTLDMRVCAVCGFVFNAAFDPSRVEYGPAYENSQDCSPAFNNYLDSLVEHLVTMCAVRTGRVVEVGCGKGVFLRKLLAHPNNSCEAVGFDPSYLGPEIVGRIRFVKDFYSPATATAADVVICRHVVEHIPEPLNLFGTVRATLGGSNPQHVYFETPCVKWILTNSVPWDFFYEHCSLFTADSLALALRITGFNVLSVRQVFNGQYLWAEAACTGPWQEPPMPYKSFSKPSQQLEIVQLARSFAANEQRYRMRWEAVLQRFADGQIFVWGAGAKGVTFCNLVDPAANRLAGVVDVNPAKQGKFLPGTGHAIVSPESALASGARAVLVLNPNYLAEVRATVQGLGSHAAVVDLMQPEELRCAS